MTDFLLLDKIYQMFANVKKPRLMFNKGICVTGYFSTYMSFSEYTAAELFSKITDASYVTARFSAMLGDWGTADTVRNIKGFAVKFHTGDNRYDIISQSLPVFFINDVVKIPELRDALSRRKSFDGIADERFWHFVLKNEESINCIIHLFSNEGISDSFENIRWYSVNTYIWENVKSERFLVRYRWMPVIKEDFSDRESWKSHKMNRIFAEFMAGFDPDTAIDNMSVAIEDGKLPSLELQAQIIDYKYSADPEYLKRTLSWNEDINTYIPLGILKLTGLANDEEDCDFTFMPGNLTKGISLYKDEFSQLMDLMHRISAYQRGGLL